MNNEQKEIETEHQNAGGLKGAVKAAANAAAKAKNAAARVQETIINAVDKNDNGQIDLDDFGIDKEELAEAKEKAQEIAADAGQKAKIVAVKAAEGLRKGGGVLAEAWGEAKFELDKRNLRPVFPEDLLADIPRMIFIVGQDKKRMGNEACQGAVGYLSTVKGVDILNLYEKAASEVGIRFYPNTSGTIYYVDPFRKNFYICLDDYFSYFKEARVNELVAIARDLGAKEVKVTIQEHKKTFVSQSGKAKAGIKKNRAGGSFDVEENDYANVKIADQEKFSGQNAPVEPDLVYFKGDKDIENLIKARMENKILSKDRTFRSEKSFGIKQQEAVEIDAVLNQMKCVGTASITSEVQRECRTEFAYSIEF